MKLTLKEIGPVHILEVSERIERGDVDSLALFFAGLIKRGPHDLVLDLSEVQHLISAVFGVIFGQIDPWQKAGKRIVIACSNEKVAALLERMGVPESVPVHPDRKSALAALSGPAPAP